MWPHSIAQNIADAGTNGISDRAILMSTEVSGAHVGPQRGSAPDIIIHAATLDAQSLFLFDTCSLFPSRPRFCNDTPLIPFHVLSLPVFIQTLNHTANAGHRRYELSHQSFICRFDWAEDAHGAIPIGLSTTPTICSGELTLGFFYSMFSRFEWVKISPLK